MSKEKCFKGNIHTHPNESDGDSSPEQVVSWYKRHEYDFLVLSDHNHLTVLKHGHDERHANSPLMIPGEEVTVALNKGKTAVHINGIGITRVVEPIDATTIISTLQANERVRDIEDKLHDLRIKEQEAVVQTAAKQLMNFHPDFEVLRESDVFLGWLDEQPPSISDGIYKNNTDVKWAARVIDLFNSCSKSCCISILSLYLK